MATAPKAVPKPPAPEEENLEEGQQSKPSGLKKIIIVTLVMLLLGAGGIAAWYLMDQQKDSTPAEKEGEEPHAEVKHDPPKPPVYVNLEQFTVNLQPDGNGDQFLQLSISLQVADQAQVDLLKLYMPQVRSRLLMLLSSKRASEISTPEGKKKLADEILAHVKQPFNAQSSPQAVSGVHFTAFVIQ